MAKARAAIDDGAGRTGSARGRRAAGALGPGMHPGRIELRAAEGSYRVRLDAGRVVAAALGAGVSPALAEECLRDGRTVILLDSPRGAVIAGALQVAPSLAPDERGTLAIDARHIRLRAAESLSLEVPGAGLLVEPGGAVRLEGDKLVIDMAAMVRIFSARVDIP